MTKPNLYLISDGDYNLLQDSSTVMQYVVIIEADDVQDSRVQNAISRVSRVNRIDRDEVVVNVLSEPVSHC